jgi:putative transposase
MAGLFLLSEAQMRRIEKYFPLSHGIARVDNRRVISGIVHVIRNGLRWRDAPREYGPHKTIYNRFVRWSRLGVFNKTFAELAGNAGKPQRLMIDATHLKAHRTAASLLKRGCSSATKAMTPTGSEKLSPKGASQPASPQKQIARNQSSMTGRFTVSATRSRICSVGSRTGDAFTHDTTDALTHSC